jgi:hypothetical protein
MRYIALAGVAVAVALLSACATPIPAPPMACERSDTATLILSGATDKAMLACAETELTQTVETVIVSSFGGDTGAARAIARLIGAAPRTLVVRGECLSSCGNYFVPAAARLRLEPGAFIGLHGTPDPLLFAGVTGADRAVIEAELAEEAAFATTFGSPRGWRIYREADASRGIVTPDMTGELRDLGSARREALLIVERAFLETCLPHVEIVGEAIAATVIEDEARLSYLRSLGGFGTGSLTCNPGTGQRSERQ